MGIILCVPERLTTISNAEATQIVLLQTFYQDAFVVDEYPLDLRRRPPYQQSPTSY